MKNRKTRIWIGAVGTAAIAAAVLLAMGSIGGTVHSTVSYQFETAGQSLEQITEEETPLAGSDMTDVSTNVKTVRLMSAAKAVALQNEQTVEETAAGATASEEPSQQEPVQQEEPEQEEQEEPEEPEEPSGPVKPEDTSDVAAMAKYIYETACTFWADEKELSGSTAREVATRVASFIGSGTFVDCAGGDAARTDSSGNTHEGYAIADDYRDYIDEPELKNFKIYLSDKDYTDSAYGAREDVTGAYYKSGAESAIYTPEG